MSAAQSLALHAGNVITPPVLRLKMKCTIALPAAHEPPHSGTGADTSFSRLATTPLSCAVTYPEAGQQAETGSSFLIPHWCSSRVDRANAE